jgi:hypothetical protein
LDDEIVINNFPSACLNPADAKTTGAKSPCWHQAIYNIPFKLNVESSQVVVAEVKLRKDCILVKPILPEIASTHEKTDLYLNRNEISLLNNFKYQEYYNSWVSSVLISKKGLKKEKPIIRIGILAPTISLALLKLMHEHYEEYEKKHNIKIIVELFINNDDKLGDFEKFKKMDKHGVITNIFNLNELMEKSMGEDRFDEEEIDEEHSLFYLDYLMVEPVDCHFGILRKNILTDILFIKKFNLHKGYSFL